MRRTWMAAAVATLTMLGCSGTDDSDTVDPATESASLSHAGASPTTANAAKGVSELFVQEDPTLDVTETAVQNAQNIQTQVTSKVQSACPGASIQLEASGATIDVNFGSDCIIANLGTVSGSASAAVSLPGPRQVQVVFTFTDLTVNGLELNGTFTVNTSNDTSFTVNSDLTVGGDTFQLKSATLTLDSNGEGATLSGAATLTTTSPVSTQSLTFNSVHHTFGSCYADSGSIQISKNATSTRGKSVPVTETVTFSSTTPTTGEATIQVGTSAATSVALPAHGQCGAATDAG